MQGIDVQCQGVHRDGPQLVVPFEHVGFSAIQWDRLVVLCVRNVVVLAQGFLEVALLCALKVAPEVARIPSWAVPVNKVHRPWVSFVMRIVKSEDHLHLWTFATWFQRFPAVSVRGHFLFCIPVQIAVYGLVPTAHLLLYFMYTGRETSWKGRRRRGGVPMCLDKGTRKKEGGGKTIRQHC